MWSWRWRARVPSSTLRGWRRESMRDDSEMASMWLWCGYTVWSSGSTHLNVSRDDAITVNASLWYHSIDGSRAGGRRCKRGYRWEVRGRRRRTTDEELNFTYVYAFWNLISDEQLNSIVAAVDRDVMSQNVTNQWRSPTHSFCQFRLLRLRINDHDHIVRVVRWKYSGPHLSFQRLIVIGCPRRSITITIRVESLTLVCFLKGLSSSLRAQNEPKMSLMTKIRQNLTCTITKI